MIPNQPPTGGTDPKVSVVEPLTNKPVTSTGLPVFNFDEQPEEKTSSGLPVFNFDEEQSQTIEPVKQEYKKTPQELFTQPLSTENTQVQKPLVKQEIYGWNQLNSKVNPKFVTNAGTVSTNNTGAQVVHKDGEFKQLKIQDYPQDVYIDPSIQSSLFTFNTPDGKEVPDLDLNHAMNFLQANRIPTMSTMVPTVKEKFFSTIAADGQDMPMTGIVIPDVKQQDLKTTFNALNDVDTKLNESISKNQESLTSLSQQMKDFEEQAKKEKTKEGIEKVIAGYENARLTYNDIASKDVYFNVWKQFKDKEEIYPEEVASQIQILRNQEKYKVLQSSGFVNAIQEDLPDNVKNFLMSSEYTNATAEDKMLYAKMLWMTNRDKFPTANDLYSKIANTFTPSVKANYLKQKAKEIKSQASEYAKRGYENVSMDNNPVTALANLMEMKKYGKPLELVNEIIGSDFENESSVLKKLGNMVEFHGDEVIPFVSTALELPNSVELYRIMNKVQHGGESKRKEIQNQIDESRKLGMKNPEYRKWEESNKNNQQESGEITGRTSGIYMPDENTKDGKEAVELINKQFALSDKLGTIPIGSGVSSLTKEEKLLYEVTSMFNAYNDIAKPDKLTTAINGIPSFISFVGEMGIAGGAPAKFMQGMIKSTAKKGIQGAMKLSPELVGGSVDIIKSMDWLTNGAYTKLANNAVRVGTYLPGLFATTSAARGLEYTDNAIKMTTPAPDMYLDESNMKYINEIVDTGSPNFWSNMAQSILLESANVGTMDVAKAVGSYQNSIALKLMNRFEKGSPGYKLLSLLEANNMERLAKQGGLQTGIEAFINRAQHLSPMSVIPDMVAFGVVLPPVEKVILGEWKDYKDQLWNNPTHILTDQIQEAAINLAVPILGGKLFGIPQLVNFEKIIRPHRTAFREFQSVVFNTPYEDFIKPEFIANLNSHINRYSETGDNKKDAVGKAMYSRLKDRLDFEQGKISGAKGESYIEYTLNSIKSQKEMTSLLEDIREGKVDAEKLNKSIEESSDDFARQQFEFHRDLVNAYATSASEGETMKEYIDKHKKEYNSIKQEFAVLNSLTTKPDWNLYEKRINDLLMPQGYKDELKAVYDELKPSIERDNEKLYGNKVGDVSNLQETIDMSSDNSIHKFTLDKESGSYKFTTNKPENADADISFRLKSMSIPDVVNFYNASRNSDMTAELKEKVGNSIKERALSEFVDNEFFSQFGGSENMGQLLDVINTVAQTNPLTPDEKQSLSNAVLNVFEIEVRRDETPENYDKVMSSVINTIQKAGVVDLTEMLKFHQRAAKIRLKSVISQMSVQNLEDAIQTTTGEDGRGLLREEVDERKRTGQLTDKQLTELIDKLNLLPINTNVDFDTLRRNNKAVERISDKIYELSKPRKTIAKDGTVSYKEPLLSENSVSLIEHILCAQNHEFLHLNGVSVDYSDAKDNASRYSEKSKTITISGNGKVSEADLVAEIIEEINHSVQHNIALSLGNGGMIGDFILTDEQLTDICGKNKQDAITAIAKWYKGKDYDYNNFLRLKDMLRSEMTDAEAQEFYAIKDMLKRFGIKYGQNWDNLRFKDVENKALQWEFTTESLVKNWNRYQEMRTAIRPGGLNYSAAQAFYYSAYSHEYFARTLGDYQIKDISAKLNDSPEVESMIDKTSNFLSKLKLPALMKAFRSKVFEKNTKPLTDMMSVADQANLEKMVSTPGETFTPEQKKNFNNILKDIAPENPTDHFRNLIQDTGNPQALNDFIISIADNATKLGYDKGIANDIVMYLNKEINITGKDIEAKRDEEIRYVSNTLKALESLNIEKTSSSNWLDKILSAGGKKVEIERYGLDEFLKNEKSPTKSDILSFLADKVMKVKDVILGGEIDKEYTRLNQGVEVHKNALMLEGLNQVDTHGDGRFSWYSGRGEFGLTLHPDVSKEQNIAVAERYLRGREKENPIETRLNEGQIIRHANNIVKHYESLIEFQKSLESYQRDMNNELPSPTRWSSYTTFPLNNYRELLPVIDTDKKLFEHTSHFPGIQNQLYHNRLNDVTTVDGKSLLLSEEMQADWGKDKKLEKLYEDLEVENASLKEFIDFGRYLHNEDDIEAHKKGIELHRSNVDTIKDFIKKEEEKQSPYTKTSDWVRAAIKRMIALAVSEGKDGIAWTPAHLQVERWSGATRAVVDKVNWVQHIFEDKAEGEQDQLTMSLFKDGRVIKDLRFYKSDISPEWKSDEGTLKEVIGSEMASKIQEQNHGSLEGDNIIVGGQGYIDIYDKTAVDVANKIGKKYGLKVGSEDVARDEENRTSYDSDGEILPPVKVHSLIFNDKLIDDFERTGSLEIFSKREQEPPTNTGEFKNIPDLIENQMNLEKEKEVGAYRGIEGLKNLEKSNPEEYRRLYKLLQDADNNFKNPNDRSYYILNYLSNGWFREKLKGKEFYKSFIDDSKMQLLESIPKYKSPGTAMLYDTVMQFIKGKDTTKDRKILKNDVDELEKHNVYLDDIITHKELFDSYPTLRNARVRFYWDENPDAGTGWHIKDDATGEITIAVNVERITRMSGDFQLFPESSKYKTPEEELKGTIMHEVQHEIQDIEGFHKGADTKYFKDNFLLYNIAMAKNAGDKVIAELLQQPNNQYIATLVDKIDAGQLVSKKEYNPQKFTVARDLNNSYFQLLKYISEQPEYKWAYDVYRRVGGEIESFDVEQNKQGQLPATLLLSLGETVKQLGYDQLIKLQDVISIEDSGKTTGKEVDEIGAKRKEEDSPIDVAWFTSLFEDKDAIISGKEVERVVRDIDDNSMKYLSDTVTTLSEANRKASEYAHNLIELWKGRVIAKALPKSSIYERKEIARLVNIPFRKKLPDYTKDINYITQIVENANFRKALSEVKQEQAFARNRFLRYNKDDVKFYSSVNKLVSVNTRMFDDIESLQKYRDLLASKPEDVNVSEFNDKVDEVWNKYLDWKKQFNDQYTGAEESISDDETILKNQMFYEKKQIIKGAVATQLVNRGATKLDRDAIDVFSRVDIDAMDEKQLKEYETALKYLLLNPESVNHKVIRIVNKYKAQEWYEQAANTLSSEYIDLINKKSLPSTGAISQYIKGLVPGVGKDKLGNISAFNVKSLLEIAEGMSSDLPGILQKEITEPINRDYQNFLMQKASAIRKISAKGKFSISENHRIGIKALLSQKPQFSVSANALETLSQNGIDISDIAVGEVLSSVNSDPNKQSAYDYILKNANAMIKESILISFGVKPDHTWSDNEMKEILGDVSVMSRRSEHQVKLELENLLKDSGFETLPELLDAMESGTHNLSDKENEYLTTLRETMNGVKDGEYSNGLNLKDASEKLYGVQFQEIQDYFPLLRYKTYLTTEKYLDPEHNEDNDAKVFYGIYNDFQMNTSFLEKRKPTVMALQTNAYEAVAKRIDQQIFYLNHVENQNYLKSVFRTPAFYGRSDMFNTESSNQIVELLNGNYNRGVNSARAEIMKDVSANFIYNAIQRYKALYVGDWLKSPGQLTTVIFNMAKMKGNAGKKFLDVATGAKQMVSSYSEGTNEQKFLENHAPEIYYRGLNTYDFVGIESGDIYEGGEGSGFIDEAKRNSGKVSGVVRGYERGIYRTNKSRLRNVASEIRNPYSTFGAEWNLAGLKFHDRVAARTSFFSSYKNYCDYLGVEASLTTPNQQALNYALESTRETQNTDNPLQKSGLSYNLIAGGSRQFPGDWAMVNLLAFKSYSINERQTLMKASQRLKNAIVEKNWSKASEEASYFAYSFASKMAFNYIKLVCQKYILSAVAAQLIGDDKGQRSALINESIGTSSQLSNVALHSFLDYFTLAEPAKWGATIGMKFLEEKAKGELSPEEKEKYRGNDALNQDMMSGFADDIVQNVFQNTAEAVKSNKEYGVTNPETLRDDSKFLLLLSQMRYGIPGASISNDLLKEMNKQRKMLESNKSNSETLYK